MTMNFSQFIDNWPESRKNQFTYPAMRALFEHLEEYEESTGEKLEFDPIALCCEYTEFDSAWDAMQQYQPEDMPVEGEPGDDLPTIQEKNEAEALKWLEERTQVIPVDGGKIIIQQF